MPALINIAKDDTKPLFIEASDITAVQFHEDKGEATVSLYNSKGQLFWFGLDNWNLDAADLVTKLRDAGVPLVRFPQRWPAGENAFKEYDGYINPAAVMYATITEVTKNGDLGAIVGVKGLGREESYSNTPEEWAELLAAVKAIKPRLREYKPEDASARWYNPAGLYIDPSAVTRIVDDGWHQVDVYFERGDRLDIKTATLEVNDIADFMMNAEGYVPDDKGNLREIFNEAKNRKEKAERAARFEFSNELAAANGTLTSIPSPVASVHINLQDVAYAKVYDKENEKTLFIEPQKTAENPYPQPIRIPFHKDEDIAKVLAVLTGTKTKPLRTSTPKAPKR